MTIITTQSRVTYAGDNVTTVFPVPFEFFLNTDITAVKTSVGGAVFTLAQNIDYTLTGAGVPGGGFATKTTALLTGETLALFLNPPITQQSHYISNAPFPAATLENDIDRQTQISQRLNDLLTRSIRFPDSDINATSTLLPSAVARALTNLGFDAAGNVSLSQALASGTLSQASIVAFLGADPITRRTPIEIAKGIFPANIGSPLGSFYRYGAKGGAVRVSDAVINGAILTSASGAFATAVGGAVQVAVVIDGGAGRVGGRPAPLITTILSVQSANQATLSTPVIAPATITMTGTLNNTVNVTGTSLNPITAGVGLTRIWAVTGTNIPANTVVSSTTNSTLVLSQAATGAGVVTLTLTAPIEVCFGYDDSGAILTALSLPYPIPDVPDAFLTTQPLIVGSFAGCANVSMPSTTLIFALPGNATPCLTAKGLDRTNNIRYLDGIRYLPYKAEFGELECCNTGLAGVSLQPSIFSSVRAHVTNTYRSAFEEFFLTDGSWQEGNKVDISCALVGHHFHHKVTKSNGSYQTLGGYRIMGRGCGLNSVFLGVNAGTQPDQLGGGIRLYTAGGGIAGDGGMSQNVWGGDIFCELDGQRTIAQSFGSDICNSAVTFVDSSQPCVIEGATSAFFSNIYRSNVFGNMVIEDITQGADVRGGYQYSAMANTVTQSSTVLSSSAGPWGQTYANPLMLNNADQLVRWPSRFSFSGLQLLTAQGNTTFNIPAISGGTGTTPAPPVINGGDYNVISVGTGAYVTLITGDFNQMFFVQDVSGGGAIGFITTDRATVTLLGSTLANLTFQRANGVGLQAISTSGIHLLRVMAFATGAA